MAFRGFKVLTAPKARPEQHKSAPTPQSVASNEIKPIDSDRTVISGPNSSTAPEEKMDFKIVIQCESSLVLPSDQPQKVNVLQLIDNDYGGNQFSGTSMIIASKDPVFKCEIINYSNEAILEVHIPVALYFFEAKRSMVDNSLESGKVVRHIEKDILITKIDAGEEKKYTTYIQNASNRFVDFRFVRPARLKPLSTEKEINSKVVWPYTETQIRGMFLPPSDIGGKL